LNIIFLINVLSSVQKTKSECVAFVYGGCGGNSNNFVSLADCQAACPPNAKISAQGESLPATISETLAVVEEQPLGDQPASGKHFLFFYERSQGFTPYTLFTIQK
jgi:Kunitz/Bovine pancreatic trypsin inhibitor domain